ncbi:MAG: hypothetical protein US18_C0013G0003 [Parcubacteria group bacterium GW2011_GWB1_36_5]|nr:MAG: hypothetical protein US12_C0026G0003 [Parcubacteria group bacterium GW2011_GWA2_36_24]KKQ07555.1 MAG: hypothetical protein US18_C0013G0003 [Parcubacteria group bacterium GW2011_GWB1_36_5]
MSKSEEFLQPKGADNTKESKEARLTSLKKGQRERGNYLMFLKDFILCDKKKVY